MTKIHKDYLEKQLSWLRNSVVYQIFPDRFKKSGKVTLQSHITLEAWDIEPSSRGFKGGDLYGIIQSLNHLQNLGITCLYLNPIFKSAANHRYHTYDYFKVDPLLGGDKALEALIDALHERGMKILLDGVFNHCGRGFWAFHNLLENGKDSPYKEWFNVHKWPLNPYADKGSDCGYGCWWNDPALPKFNHENAEVEEYLLEVASFWTQKGIDGWRLDVPDEVPKTFWLNFRKKVKSINPKSWIIGEIWGDARYWLDDDTFDGVMNYRIGWSTLSWIAGNEINQEFVNPSYPLRPLNAKKYIEIIETTFNWYKDETNFSQLNLLDSHDLPRALNTLKGDFKALKLSLFLLFIQPGVPCIYYGTEAGLSGGIEPSCRESFPWERLWGGDLIEFINSLVNLRGNFSEDFFSNRNWSYLGEDGLSCIFKKSVNLSLNKDNLMLIYVNRSRSNWLSISNDLVKPSYLLGEIDLSKSKLGPQSAVVFNYENMI